MTGSDLVVYGGEMKLIKKYWDQKKQHADEIEKLKREIKNLDKKIECLLELAPYVNVVEEE